MVERVLVGRLAGRLELEVQVLEEVDPADAGSCIRAASPKIGCSEFSSIIFSALRIDPVNSSETWFAPELISAERMIDSGSPGQCRSRWNSSKTTTRCSDSERSATSCACSVSASCSGLTARAAPTLDRP